MTLTGSNMADLINMTPLTKGEEMPKVEQVIEKLVDKLARLQQGKTALKKEIKELESVCDSLRKELAMLNADSCQLEKLCKEREELCRNLQFQCDESEQDSIRQVEQNKKSEELLEQYRCEIQGFKLKHREQRMNFENQLHQLIEQHKNLQSIFMPQSLPAEIESAENRNKQLLSAEELKLAELHRLSEALKELKKQKQLETTAAKTQEV